MARTFLGAIVFVKSAKNAFAPVRMMQFMKMQRWTKTVMSSASQTQNATVALRTTVAEFALRHVLLQKQGMRKLKKLCEAVAFSYYT